MDQNDGKLIRINDPSEIKVGMACKLINCYWCSKDHIFNITGICELSHRNYSGDAFTRLPDFHRLGGTVDPNDGHLFCKNSCADFVNASKEGRLFAIVDENPNFEETTVVKNKTVKILDKIETNK